MKAHHKLSVGHKKYDELLLESMSLVYKNISREEFIDLYLGRLFEISQIKYLVVLETYCSEIESIDDLELFYCKDRDNIQNFRDNIKSKHILEIAKKRIDNFNIKLLNRYLSGTEDDISWMTQWGKLNFCTAFVPIREYENGGWVNIINLKRASIRHPHRLVLAWYSSDDLKNMNTPPSFRQDERAFYFMQHLYDLISFSIKSKARTIFEHRLELLKEITPSIINHEVLTNLKVSLSSFSDVSKKLKELNVDTSILEIIETNLEMLEYTYSLADSVLKVTKRVEIEDVNMEQLFNIIYRLMRTKLATESGSLNVKEVNFSSIIRSDSSLLIHLLLNLVINAMEAYKDANIEYDRKIYLSAIDLDAKYMAIYVSDDAKIIEGDLKERIFEQGFTTKERGHGLGLTICKYITNFLGGDLYLEESVEYKTRFVIKLPKEFDKLNELEEEILYE